MSLFLATFWYGEHNKESIVYFEKDNESALWCWEAPTRYFALYEKDAGLCYCGFKACLTIEF
jgi:hypothetical protein